MRWICRSLWFLDGNESGTAGNLEKQRRTTRGWSDAMRTITRTTGVRLVGGKVLCAQTLHFLSPTTQAGLQSDTGMGCASWKTSYKLIQKRFLSLTTLGPHVFSRSCLPSLDPCPEHNIPQWAARSLSPYSAARNRRAPACLSALGGLTGTELGGSFMSSLWCWP